MSTDLDIYYPKGGVDGWLPITHMAKLAADLLGGRLHDIKVRKVTRRQRLWHSLRPQAPKGASHALYIARTPLEAISFMQSPDFAQKRRHRALWIIDSFWTEFVPSARLLKHFDTVAYMQLGEAALYEKRAPGRSLFLGWGSDALGLGAPAMASLRGIDVLRVGRQPGAWDDDGQNAQACAAQGLSFQGRPPSLPSPEPAYIDLMSYYGRSKYIVAHSNLVDQSSYTHGQKDYMTARWTDPLASGALVAGLPPFRDASVDALLWPGALLSFETVELETNVAQLKQAAASWSPALATGAHLNALRHLDWRWRFKDLAERMEISSPRLDNAITLLNERITALEGSPAP